MRLSKLQISVSFTVMEPILRFLKAGPPSGSPESLVQRELPLSTQVVYSPH